MTFSCMKMAGKAVVQATSSGQSPPTKVKTTFSEEETEKLISLWSEEEVLFNCRLKDYLKKDLRQNATNHILLALDKQGKPMTSLKLHRIIKLNRHTALVASPVKR